MFNPLMCIKEGNVSYDISGSIPSISVIASSSIRAKGDEPLSVSIQMYADARSSNNRTTARPDCAIFEVPIQLFVQDNPQVEEFSLTILSHRMDVCAYVTIQPAGKRGEATGVQTAKTAISFDSFASYYQRLPCQLPEVKVYMELLKQEREAEVAYERFKEEQGEVVELLGGELFKEIFA